MIKKIFSNTFVNLGFIIAIGAFVLWLVLKDDPDVILNTIASADPWILLLALFLVFVWQFMVGLCLKVLTNITHPEYRASQGLLNSFVASLFHGLTPSASGGQIAQIYVYKKQGVDIGDSGSVLWLEFIIYQSVLTLVSLFFIIIKFPYFYSNFSNLFAIVIIGFALNTAIIFFIYGLAKFKRLHEWIKNKGVYLGHRVHLVKDPEKTIASIEVQLEKFRSEAEKLRHNKGVIIKCGLLCVIRLLVYYAIPYVVFLALGVPLSFELFLNSIAMGSFVSIATGLIPIPGASGGAEAIFVLMFGNLFGANIVSGAMLLWRFLTFYLVMFIGAGCFAYLRLKR